MLVADCFLVSLYLSYILSIEINYLFFLSMVCTNVGFFEYSVTYFTYELATRMSWPPKRLN